jgi:hypothetical protein
MITVRCADEDCIEEARFFDAKQAEDAGWYVDLDPGTDPSDGCPEHAKDVRANADEYGGGE